MIQKPNIPQQKDNPIMVGFLLVGFSIFCGLFGGFLILQFLSIISLDLGLYLNLPFDFDQQIIYFLFCILTAGTIVFMVYLDRLSTNNDNDTPLYFVLIIFVVYIIYGLVSNNWTIGLL